MFLVAGLTDALDGLIARQTGQKSELGAWLDPAADKLLLVTTFIVLTLPNIGLVNRIPIWLTVLMISRDVGIVLTVAIVNLASGPRTFRPSQLGKAATAFFIVTCVVVMFFNWLGVTSVVVDVFVWTSLAITLASGIDYVWRIGRPTHARPSAGTRPGPAIGGTSRRNGTVHQSTRANRRICRSHAIINLRLRALTAPSAGSTRWSCRGPRRAAPSAPIRAASARA